MAQILQNSSWDKKNKTENIKMKPRNFDKITNYN